MSLTEYEREVITTLREVSDRTARLEAMHEAVVSKDHDRIGSLEKSRDRAMGSIMILSAAFSVLVDYLKTTFLHRS